MTMHGTPPGEENQGLQSPSGTVIEELEPPRRRSKARMVMQALGVVIGLALLAWAISIGFSAENRAGLEAIRHAKASDLALLLSLTVVAIVFNGILFWASQPRASGAPRKVSFTDAIAGNALATFLGNLPFKISVLVRGLIHHRRNGVRFGELAAWFAAIAAMALAVLLPVGAATLWRGRLDALWWIAAMGGIGAAGITGVALGHLAGRHAILRRLSLGADRIVRDPVIMGANLALRFLDVLLFSWRFQVAGHIVGVELPFEQAALLGTGYFLIVVLGPFGPLGFAEMGVAGLATLIGRDAPAIALLALTVTVATVSTSLAMSIPAAWWLRLDRVFGPGRLSVPRSETGG